MAPVEGERNVVHEKPRTPTMSEVEVLRSRVEKAEAEVQQTRQALRVQGQVLVTWRRQLNDQEKALRLMKKERDEQMRDIASSVMLVEAELRREQTDIVRALKDKDRTVTEQEKQIHALLVLNRKLASTIEVCRASSFSHKVDNNNIINGSCSLRSKSVKCGPVRKRVVSCHSFRSPCACKIKCNVNRQQQVDRLHHLSPSVIGNHHPKENGILENGNSVNGHSENGEDESEAETDGKEDSDDEDHVNCNGHCGSEESHHSWDHLRAVEESVRNYHQNESNDVSYVYYPAHPSHIRHLNTLEAVDEEDEADSLNGTDHDAAVDHQALLHGSFEQLAIIHDRGKHLSASYNRVMSNHRNMTKPKDVKYKKINRVKSRSLEELRGKLRNWTHPFFAVAEKST